MDRAMELGENLVRYGIKVDVYKPQLDNNENILFPSKKLKIKNKTKHTHLNASIAACPYYVND